jgi:nicotinate-nucleotide adenylyltransferase
MPDGGRLGIFGGTFDPVHIGHLAAAVEVRAALGLERMLLVVAPDPWQKQGTVVAPAAARNEMLVAALADLDGLEASRIELDRDGPTYTIDTVEQLRAAEPGHEIVLAVGSDVAATIDTWHRADELRALVTLAVVNRAGVPPVDAAGWRTVGVTMPRLDVSSTDLRARVAEDRPIDVLVPPAAVRVLRAHRLYTRS